jgi:hypothetical protein
LNGYVGGVTAIAQGTVTYNTNEGTITSTSDVESLHIGGVVGAWLSGDAVFNHNTIGNTSNIVAEGAALHTYAGGLAGLISENVASIEIDLTKYNGSFAGKVTAGVCQSNSQATISAGGIFGKVMTNVTISNIAEWTGTVTFYQQEAISSNCINFGGFVGWATTPITISNIVSNGDTILSHTKAAAINTTGGSFGGFVGRCENGATISDCTNNGQTAWTSSNTGSSNGNDINLGGIVGRIVEGNSSIINCHNKGKIANMHYNNLPWSTTYNTNCSGGIIGSFGAKASPVGAITIEKCTNAANISAYRGAIAGIAGFLANATVKGCEYRIGAIEDQVNVVCAGIAGIAADSHFIDCVATVNMSGYNAGSLDMRAGGIVAHLMGTSSVSNCSYYGEITPKKLRDKAPEYFGGIAGLAQDETISITNCCCGGTINGNVISDNNLSTYIINYSPNGGAATNATVTGCSYWDGK